VEPSVVKYLPLLPVWLGKASTAAHSTPSAAPELALRKYPFVPTESLPGVSADVATIKSPFASRMLLGIAVATSNAVKVIISITSEAASAGLKAVMLVPLVAV